MARDYIYIYMYYYTCIYSVCMRVCDSEGGRYSEGRDAKGEGWVMECMQTGSKSGRKELAGALAGWVGAEGEGQGQDLKSNEEHV